MRRIFLVVLMFFTLLVSGCSLIALEFEEVEINLAISQTYQLTPTIELLSVEYETKDEKVAQVTTDGLVTAVGIGETNIVATYKKQTVTIIVNVYELAGELAVYFIDVGQGDTIFIKLPNNETMLIDAAWGYAYKAQAEENIRSILDEHLSDTIDHFIITHNHEDHYGFVPMILSDYGAKNVYGSGSTRTNAQYLTIMQSIENAGLDYLVVEVGDVLIEEDNLFIQVVATQRIENETDPNLSSVMVRIVFGETAFMFTGDGGFKNSRDAEHIALNSGLDLRADVLKVGHHGSRNSSGDAFLAAVKPKYAILTTSVNTRDGLPTIEALDRLTRIGATLYQTKDLGTIKVTSNGSTITIGG